MGYISKYKPFLLFLAKFFLTYAILGFVYQTWLGRYENKRQNIDPITVVVAEQSAWIIKTAGAEGAVVPHKTRPFMKLFFNGQYTARIIEGCNAVSVMILFIAFIVAFAGSFKTTVLFGLAGCVTIHILNVGRIALLASAIYHFPEHENFLHSVVFPLIIYGVVFILWVIWVNRFSFYADAKK